MYWLLRGVLTLSAISFFVVIYMVNNEYTIIDFFSKDFAPPVWVSSVLSISDWISYSLYIAIVVGLSMIALRICQTFKSYPIGQIECIEVSNNDFLSNYLALFFVALAIPGDSSPFSVPVFWVIFFVTFILISFSRTSYFNPVFLVFGYNFYYITTCNKVKTMLISKQNLKCAPHSEMKVARINDYTFIEIK